jgi:hypothetical protein
MPQQPKQAVAPQYIQLPNGDYAEFPGDISDSEIAAALAADFPSQKTKLEQAGSAAYSAVSDFAGNFTKQISPVPQDFKLNDIVEGPKHAIAHPFDSFGLLGGAVWEGMKHYAGKTKEAFNAPTQGVDVNNPYELEASAAMRGGDIARNAIGTIPLIGPPVAEGLEDISQGRYAAGLGTLTGLAFPELAAYKLRNLKNSPPRMVNSNAQQAANQVMRDSGGPGIVNRSGWAGYDDSSKLGARMNKSIQVTSTNPGVDMLIDALDKNPDTAYKVLLHKDLSKAKLAEVRAAVGEPTYKAMVAQLQRDFFVSQWQEAVPTAGREGRFKRGMLDAITQTEEGQALQRVMNPRDFAAFKEIARRTTELDTTGAKISDGLINILQTARGFRVPGVSPTMLAATKLARILTRPEGQNIVKSYARAVARNNHSQAYFWSKRLSSYADREFAPKKEQQKPLPPIPGGG